MPVPRPASEPLEVIDTAGLARLIAARDDRLRVAKRRCGETVNEYRSRRWDGRTLPTLPFAVYLASDGNYRTLAFDLDASHGDVEADATLLRAMLAESGVRFVEAASGPWGGRHTIATFCDQLPAAAVAAPARHLARVLPTLDVTPLCNPATGCIRPPGAPHRGGGASVMLTPIGTAAAALAEGNRRGTFDRLCARAGIPARATRRRLPRPARPQRPLSPAIQRLQRDGDVDGRWPDRSGPAAAICLGYVEAGRPFAEFLRAALGRTNHGLDHLRRVRVGPGRYRPRSEPEIRAAAERMWRGRVRYAEEHPATGNLDALITAVLAAADASPARWAGQGGPSDRAALRAVAHLVATRRAPVVSAGTRTISELTGCTQSTADRALRRLTRDGWLIRVTPGRGTDAATYRLAIPQERTGDRLPAGPVVDGSLAPAPPRTDRLSTMIAIQSHDAMTHEGLGRHAAAVQIALTDQPGTLADLARRTGLTRRSVRRQLARLAAAGLARRHGPGWAAADPAELDRAADQLGVTGTVARRAAAHAAERATWRWLQADIAARCGFTVERGLWTPGRQTLSGADPRPVPSMPFPRCGGRADVTRGLRLLLAGHGPTAESVQRVLDAVAATGPGAAPPRSPAVPPRRWGHVAAAA